jgi:PAS domain S-box-containing protein
MATVLVVDDDATNRTYLRTLLVHRGHDVREAADGGSAARLAEQDPPDAVITDILMPGDLDGYELARRLRSAPATRHIPIAFSTAHYDEREIESLARACGVLDVIVKPARPTAVLATIDALLSGVKPDPSGPFVDEHRRALKSKLLQKSSALSRTKDHLRAVVECTRVGVVLANSDATATYVNPRLAEMAGLPAGSLLGHGWLAWLDAADRERLRAVVEAGVPRGGRSYRVAARRVGLGPRWLDIRLHPTTDSSAGDLVAVVEDVTETGRARSEGATTGQLEAVRRHAADLADRLDETERVTAAGGWEFDRRSGLIVLSGRLAELLDLPAAMLSPDELWRRVHPADGRRAAAMVAGTIRTGRVGRFPLRVAGDGGVVRHFVVSSRPSSVDIPAWGVAHDVTDAVSGRIDAAVAADRSAERRLLDRIHRQLLPDRMPDVPGVRVAAAYRAVPDRLDSGGDWYDAVPAPGARAARGRGDGTGVCRAARVRDRRPEPGPDPHAAQPVHDQHLRRLGPRHRGRGALRRRPAAGGQRRAPGAAAGRAGRPEDGPERDTDRLAGPGPRGDAGAHLPGRGPADGVGRRTVPVHRRAGRPARKRGRHRGARAAAGAGAGAPGGRDGVGA